MPRPATVGHPAFRVFKRARADANRGLNAILVALRLGRYELGRLPRSQRDVLLGEYYRYEIDDIGDFNYRAAQARDHMADAERDLAYMAVPFSTSLYEDYLADLAALLGRSGHGRPQLSGGAVKLHTYIANAGASLPTQEALLFEAVRTTRNCIVHDAGVANAVAVRAQAAVASDATAAATWKRITKQDPATLTEGKRIPLTGREALVALYVISQCAYAINNAASGVISREVWADVAVLDFRAQLPQRWQRRLTPLRTIRRIVDKSYALLGLTDDELREATRRAPTQLRLP